MDPKDKHIHRLEAAVRQHQNSWHEINGALTGLQFFRMIAEEVDLDPEHKEMLTIGLRALDRAEYIARLAHLPGMLDTSEQKIDLYGIAYEVGSMHLRMENDIDYSIQFGPDSVYLRAPEFETFTIIRNVVVNAMHAIRKTGYPGLITVDARYDGSYSVIDVRDNGIGMDDETLALATKRDYTTRDHSQGGRGIGLDMVKTLVEDLEGKLHLESEGIGKGSTVHLYLPTNLPQESTQS